MNNVFMTSEQINDGVLRKGFKENYKWIEENEHQLDDMRMREWNAFRNLKSERITIAGKWLHWVRYMYDPIYRVSSKGEALLNRIKQYEADTMLKEAHKSLKRDTQELDRNKYQNSDIWISDRHFR